MIPNRNRQRCWSALVQTGLCLIACGVTLQSSSADEPDIQLQIAETLQSGLWEQLSLSLEEANPDPAPIRDSAVLHAGYSRHSGGYTNGYWRNVIRVGYDDGFVIASQRQFDLQTDDAPFLLQITGMGQLRHTNFASDGPNRSVNQFQLKRGRLVFSGHAFTPDFTHLNGAPISSTSLDIFPGDIGWLFRTQIQFAF